MDRPDILLVILPPYGFDMPPLNIAYLAGYLRCKNVKVEVRDSNILIYRKLKDVKKWDFSRNPDWMEKGWLDNEEVRGVIEKEIDAIISIPAPIIGFSVHASNRSLTSLVVREIKKRDPSRKIILGGRGVYDSLGRSHFPPGSVDAFVMGEGEEALYRLVQFFKGDGEENIPGVVWVKNGEEIILSPPQIIPITSIPHPTFEEFDLQLYEGRKLPLLMSRGCILHCAYCDDHRAMGRYRVRKAEDVFQEIKFHVEKWGIREFVFNDPAINGNLKELGKLCDLIIDEGLPISWMALAIPRPDMGDLYQKMKKAGCHTLNFGVESGSDRVLKLMNKPFSSREIAKSIRMAYEAGINTQLNFILGFPGEREEDVEETLKFIEENAPYISGITNLNACHLLINSPLWDERIERGIKLPEDFRYFDRYWEEGENTLSTRIRRVKRVKRFLESKGIPLWTTNIGEYEKEKAFCLVFLPPWGVEMPPLGLVCLYSYLQNKGYQCEVRDLNILLYQRLGKDYPVFWQRGKSELFEQSRFYTLYQKEIRDYLRETAERLVEEGYSVFGFSTNYANLPLVKFFSSLIKEMDPDLKIIWGGPGVYWEEDRRRVISERVDFVVVGEGEEALCQLLNGNRTFAGIALKEEGFRLTREPIPLNLKEYPKLDFSAMPLSLYSSSTLPIFLTRGCKGRCSYCNERELLGPFRYRDPEKVVEEIKYWVEKGFTDFQFMDQAVNSDSQVFRKFLTLVKEAGLKFKWEANFMIKRKDIELFPLMKEAGVKRIFIGLESGSEKVLRKMRKTFSPKIAEEFLKEADSQGIECWVNLIAGHPGEGESEFSETREFIKRNSRYIAGVLNLSSCLIPPGSLLEKKPEKFSIYLPPYEHWFRWREGNNTSEVREERVNILEKDIKNLGLPLETVNRVKKGTDILLVNPAPWGVENPPLSLVFLSRYAREKGFRVEVYDLNLELFERVPPEYKLLWHVENKNFWARDNVYPFVEKLLEPWLEEACKEILRLNPSLLGFSVVDGKERLTISLIKRLRAMGAKFPIILGGPSASTPKAREIFVKEVGDEIAGYVVGEGEETLVEIAGRIKEGRDLDGIKGVAVKKGDEWYYQPRPWIKPLDSLPIPDYAGFDVGRYPGDELLLEWSRGCIGRCAFCKNPRIVKSYRYHEPPWVVEEIEHHVEKLRVRKFTVIDPLMNGYLPQLEGICDLILAKKLDIEWYGQVAPRRDMSFELLKKMKEAGCYKLQIGVESGSRKVLKKMRKFYTPEDAENVIRRAKEAGMGVEIFIMVGFPGEGEKEFYQTYEFIERNASYIDKIKSINTLHLIEDTDVYENHSSYGIHLPQDNWHYLWWTEDGNDYEVRKRRGEILLKLAWEKGISVQEVNFAEGKEREVRNEKELVEVINKLHPLSPPASPPVNLQVANGGKEEEIGKLQQEVVNLREELRKILESRGWKVLKKVVRWKRALILTLKRIFHLPRLLFLLLLTLVVESYLYFLKRIRKLIIFPD